MTFQELQDVLLDVPRNMLNDEITIFDYSTNEFMELPDLKLCLEGKPRIHLTIN